MCKPKQLCDSRCGLQRPERVAVASLEVRVFPWGIEECSGHEILSRSIHFLSVFLD